jgi:hypothetical protein
VPEGEGWRLVALRREVVAHGGAVTRCARRGEREVALALAGATDAEALLARCAHGMLRGPLRADDQSPSQGTGSSVAP